MNCSRCLDFACRWKSDYIKYNLQHKHPAFAITLNQPVFLFPFYFCKHSVIILISLLQQPTTFWWIEADLKKKKTDIRNWWFFFLLIENQKQWALPACQFMEEYCVRTYLNSPQQQCNNVCYYVFVSAYLMFKRLFTGYFIKIRLWSSKYKDALRSTSQLSGFQYNVGKSSSILVSAITNVNVILPYSCLWLRSLIFASRVVTSWFCSLFMMKSLKCT